MLRSVTYCWFTSVVTATEDPDLSIQGLPPRDSFTLLTICKGQSLHVTSTPRKANHYVTEVANLRSNTKPLFRAKSQNSGRTLEEVRRFSSFLIIFSHQPARQPRSAPFFCRVV
ncbi:hypothetical protein AVEN_76895-1 [Araneus ventricosus]|uniref:Uncharacterized protein n=1 Tax=Araneus ventricosus TaxID=182803 RepID=A0A4Y2B5S3_ARAVE|nr:hypothetical protein AVEN_76895-1 [Araneus ventricosus]